MQIIKSRPKVKTWLALPWSLASYLTVMKYAMVFAGVKKTKRDEEKCLSCFQIGTFQNVLPLGNSLTVQGFPDSWVGKESTCNVGDLGSIPGLGRFPGEGKGYPLQYSGLENSMDCVHGVAQSWTRLNDFHFPSLWQCSR